ncbi:MAG: class I SAM-dependent methyltransferase [Gemmobacter sp.]
MWDRALDAMLRDVVRTGSLALSLPGGRTLRYGQGEPSASLHITDPAVVARLVRSPELAMGEAYMAGTLVPEGPRGLHALLAVLLANTTRRVPRWYGAMLALRRAGRWIAQWNPAPRARRNVAHHYDLSGTLYDLFLDADKQYSCAYFARPGMTLDEAQAAKKALIAAKLRLEPGMRVLDIGCGWGGLALTLAREHGAHVVGVTLSAEQLKVAQARAAAAGLADRVEFRLQDYRAVTGAFDRIVSVGMFEHVGVPHYGDYFRTVADRLAPDGIALIHTIGRNAPPAATSPWITKYIFPGGYVPALSEVAAPIEASGLWMTDIEVWRLHYADTLRAWQERFEANIDAVRALYDDRFCRMWRFYLVASEMSFRAGRQCVFQMQLSHRQDAVPLTRDYLYRDRANA